MFSGMGAGTMRLGVMVALSNKAAMLKLSQMEKRVGRFGNVLRKMSTTFVTGGAAIAGGLALSVKAAGDFEQALANTNSVANATGAEFAQMRALALNMGKTTTTSATTAASAMYSLASSGQKAGEIMSTLPGIIKLSSATAHELGSTTETVVATLKGYGMEATETGRVTNTFAAAIGASMANMDRLSQSMTYVAPIAKAAGVSFEETVAALSMLYDRGMQGSMAGTALRRVLQSIVDPTDELRARLIEAGVAEGQLTPGMASLGEIMDAVAASGIDLGEVFQDFGARGAVAATTMIQEGSAGLNKMQANFKDTTALSRMYATQTNTLNAQLKILWNTLQAVAIQVGEKLMPFIRRIVEHIKRWADRIANLNPKTIEMAAKIAAVASVGLILVGVIGKLSAVLGAATGPIGLILLALTGLVAAYQWAGNTLNEYHEHLREGRVEEAKAMEGKARFAATIKALFSAGFWKALGKDIVNWAKLMGATFVALATTAAQQFGKIKDIINPKNWFKKDFWSGLASDFGKGLQENLAELATRWKIDLPFDREGTISNVAQYIQDALTEGSDVAKELGVGLGEKIGSGIIEGATTALGEWQGPPLPPDAVLEPGQMLGPSLEEWEEWKSRMESLREYANETAASGLATTERLTQGLLVTEGKYFKAMKKVFAQFLKDTLMGVVRQKAQELLAAKIVAVGEALMKGTLNWAALAAIPGILAAYGAAVAALGSIKSFHSGGVPYEEIIKVRPRREAVIDLPSAQRGGFGASYLPAAAGAGVSVTIQTGDVHVRTDADIDRIAQQLGGHILDHLATHGV